MIGFHGDDDVTAIPFDREENSPTPPTPDNNPSRNTTGFCLDDQVTVTHSTGPGKPSDFHAIGTYNLYNLLRQFGQQTEIYIDCSMNHGINDLNDNFGTNPATIDDITIYTVVRASVFFQWLILHPNDPVPGPSRFINKANNRYNYTNASQCLSTSEAVADPDDPTLAIDRSQCGSCKAFVTDCN